MSIPDINATCHALATQLQHHLDTTGQNNLVIIGIRTGGVWVAQQLIDTLSLPGPLYSVDISFYRDDFAQKGLNPKVHGSELPDTLEDRHILLIDDVIMSGRTTRAAINELFDYGRPASITLACLLDVGQRELPLQPDLCGAKLTLEADQRIKLGGPAPLTLSII